MTGSDLSLSLGVLQSSIHCGCQLYTMGKLQCDGATDGQKSNQNSPGSNRTRVNYYTCLYLYKNSHIPNFKLIYLKLGQRLVVLVQKNV